MTKRIQAKHKIERRLGVDLWGRASSPVHVRATPPGQHGIKGPRRLTDYGQQLAEKQKLRGYYGNIVEKQFRNTYAEAERLKGDTGANLLALLERRLDAIVYRLKWVPTVFAARQMVSHRHVMVNGRRVNIPSYRVRVGDVITLRSEMRKNTLVVDAMASTERDIPGYIEFDAQQFSGKLLYAPDTSEIPYPVEMNVSAVVEFYAR